MVEDRTYMVSGEDAAGDYDLFATDDEARAEARYAQMLGTHTNVQAPWMYGRRANEDE